MSDPLEPNRLSSPDPECICQGNWRQIVKECEPLLDRKFKDSKGRVFTFFGVVHGRDDYYYGMSGESGTVLLSCVGDFEGHGFTPL
jgi:hypothetical protein